MTSLDLDVENPDPDQVVDADVKAVVPLEEMAPAPEKAAPRTRDPPGAEDHPQDSDPLLIEKSQLVRKASPSDHSDLGVTEMGMKMLRLSLETDP